MRKITLIVCTLFFLITAFPFSSLAASMKTEWKPVHLRVNDYYVLHAYPKAPYIDKQNRLQLPLRSVADLLSAEISYNSITKTAQVIMLEHTLKITLESNVYYVNNEKKTMDTTPVLYENALFIPVRVLLDSFNIKENWDNNKKLLSISDASFLKHYKFTNFLDLDREANLVQSRSAFEPVAYKLSMANEKGYWQGNITVQAKNMTGSDVDEGKEDLHPIMIFTRSSGTHDVNSSRPMVKANEVIMRTFDATPPIGENLEYILIEGRVLK
jgi:hypothetical protein